MGLIPIKVKSCKESPSILGVANAFSGGVFIAIGLMHIMPEQAEAWDKIAEEQGIENPFPLPYLLMVTGYTIILILDKVLFDAHAVLHDDGGGDAHGHDHDKKNVTRASLVLRDSMAQIMKDPNNDASIKKSLRASVVKLENEIK